jgi:hypothetical protein
MEAATLVSMLDFAHARLLGTLDAIEKSGEDVAKVLTWRPADGRAHIGWQILHCAATHDRYFHGVIRGQNATDATLVAQFGGGSTPEDGNIPAASEIRAKLEKHFAEFRKFVAACSPQELDKEVGPPDRRRKLGDAVVLLAWHEAHHQGQAHLTWNLYRSANGIV